MLTFLCFVIESNSSNVSGTLPIDFWRATSRSLKIRSGRNWFRMGHEEARLKRWGGSSNS